MKDKVMRESKNRSVTGGLLVLACLSAALLAATGCDSLFEVTNPQELTPDDLGDPSAADAIANGAAINFADAYDDLLVDLAVPTDEFIFSGARFEWQELDEGRISIFNERVSFNWANLSAARATADDAVTRLQELLDAPQSSPLFARSLLYAGFARILFAESWEQVTFDGGPPMSPQEVLQAAIAQLTEAFQVAQTAGDDGVAAAALGGRARAHFSLFVQTDDTGELTAAAQDAEAALGVDPGFAWLVNYQQPGSINFVQEWNHIRQTVSVSPRYRRLTDPASGQRDPRVPVSDFISTGRSGPQDSIFFQLKYPTADDEIPLVKWQEMKLIIAESRLEAGNVAGAVAAINELRTRSGVDLPPFDSSDPQEVFEQLIYERSAELWLEGRRWQDARRSGQMPPQAPEDQWADPSQTIDPLMDVFPIPNTELQTNPNL